METIEHEQLVTLDLDRPVWKRFFTVASLVVVGTREDGEVHLAPRHWAMPLGGKRYYGFVDAPHHRTHQNIEATGSFAVSYPWPDQVTATSLRASQHDDGLGFKPSVREKLPTFPATTVDGAFLKDAYLFLECERDRVIDDLDDNSLIIGRVVAVHVHKDMLRVSDGNDQERIHEAPLLAYLHPGRYAAVRDTKAFPLSDIPSEHAG